MLINEGLYRQVHGNTLYNYSQNTVNNKYSIQAQYNNKKLIVLKSTMNNQCNIFIYNLFANT